MRIQSLAPLWVISGVSVGIFFAVLTLKELHLSLTKNISVSAPIGIYLLRAPKQIEIGKLVTFKLPKEFEAFAKNVAWLKEDEDLLKPVAAVKGDLVCRRGSEVSINGSIVARAKDNDTHGHILPSWQGCQVIQTGYFFPLSLHHENSFDGRYFGVVRKSLVTNVAKPLIVF